ncbi:DUF2971 domain-containing protein [Photobacterium sp. SDRW27]|uniref:DUF2971 domain-containing protein n=1 Tax=Photobacterium obscurum TaxID=2829490 RepID=UPI002244BA0D|nr:DUF2971 domain-containing protein [Photobacterium obscurum]MCW8331749.1 DUF2971 domain-containing protein [Photobacterium obscurum]
MKFKEIKALYKYRPFNEFTLDIIVNNEIYFPKPEVFNDPYDCNIKMINSISNKDYEKILKWQGNKLGKSKAEIESQISLFKSQKVIPSDYIDKINAGIDAIQLENKNVGVLSLSSDCRNILMWAHYADDHKGMCIEFERDDNNILGDIGQTKPINYTRSYPSISPLDFTRELNGSIVQKMLWSKSKDWAYEKEWRVISEKGNLSLPVPGKISAIIFGIRASKRSIDIVRKITDGTGIKLKQAEKLASDFGVKVVKTI